MDEMEPEAKPEKASGEGFIKLVTIMLGSSLVVTLLLSVLLVQNSQRASHMAWEYKIEDISDSGFSDRMNVLGKQGWEMVSGRRTDDSGQTQSGYEVIFKRPVSGGK